MTGITQASFLQGTFARKFIKGLTDGVLLLNGADIIEWANEAAFKLLGKNDIVGKPVLDMLASPDQALVRGLSEKRTVRGPDFSLIHADEEENTELGGVLIFHSNECASKNAANLMERANSIERSYKELDHFAHIVSHDLKAPLRAISNLSLWLQEDLGDSLSDENREHLLKLRNRVQRMESLINGILEYSRVGREQIATEVIDVYKLVRELVDVLSPSKEISVQVDEGLPVIEGKRIMLLQVFSNLMSNAIKYNDKADGRIKVYGSKKPGHAEFVVEDNGPGIAPEYHEKIFEIFQTLQSRDKFESTGIGLTIVRKILDAVGGTIRVESREGEGAKFIFTWPTSNMLNEN